MLDQQVRRMLADPDSQALVDNFAGAVAVPAQPAERRTRTVDEFPNFDDNLRQAFRRETELFFDSIMREDRSVLDLLTAELHVRQRAARPALRHSRTSTAASSAA